MVDTNDDEKLITHPLEQVFDIEENTTLVPHKTIASTKLVVHDDYDPKDVELDSQFQDVYDAAFEAYENQAEETELIEPKYKARNAEVAVQYLNAALNAASAKSNLKQHNDKVSIAARKASGAGDSGLFPTDRNELLRALAKRAEEMTEPVDEPIDADFTETPEE